MSATPGLEPGKSIIKNVMGYLGLLTLRLKAFFRKIGSQIKGLSFRHPPDDEKDPHQTLKLAWLYGLGVLIIAVVIGGVWLFRSLPGWLRSPGTGSPIASVGMEAFRNNLEARKLVAQLTAGVVAIFTLLFGLIKTLVSEKESRIKNEEIRGVREEAAHGRFMRSVELLSAAEQYKISGAIVELERIGTERADFRNPVQHILAKFIREQSREMWRRERLSSEETSSEGTQTAAPSDLQKGTEEYTVVASIREAMNAIRGVRSKPTKKLAEVDFTGAWLVESNLADLNWSGCTFIKCNMERSFLDRARFCNARFDHTRLRRASVQGATFDGVRFGEATTFEDADLTGASFRKCEGTGISFKKAKVESYFDGSTFEQSLFAGAILRGADIKGGSLGGSEFEYVADETFIIGEDVSVNRAKAEESPGLARFSERQRAAMIISGRAGTEKREAEPRPTEAELPAQDELTFSAEDQVGGAASRDEARSAEAAEVGV